MLHIHMNRYIGIYQISIKHLKDFSECLQCPVRSDPTSQSCVPSTPFCPVTLFTLASLSSPTHFMFLPVMSRSLCMCSLLLAGSSFLFWPFKSSKFSLRGHLSWKSFHKLSHSSLPHQWGELAFLSFPLVLSLGSNKTLLWLIQSSISVSFCGLLSVKRTGVHSFSVL